MRPTIKARYHNGVLQPLEPLARRGRRGSAGHGGQRDGYQCRGNFAAYRTGLPGAHRRRHRTCGGHRFEPAALLRYNSRQVTKRRGGP